MNLRENSRKIMKHILVISLIIVFFCGLSIYELKSSDVKKISLIVYGSDAKRWENLLQGAELAGEQENGEISLITMSSEDDYEEQIRIIEREVNDGADALIVAACNSEKIGEYIDNARIKIPVIFAESGVTSKKSHKCINADDYMMGYSLGRAICENEKTITKVAIVSDGTQRNSISERERGVRDAIKDYIKNVVTWERKENEKQLLSRVFLQRELVSEAVDVIVTLDNSMTNSLMGALDNLNKKSMTSRIYSISTSDEAVFSLDQKQIKVLTYQSEFGIGYIGTMVAIDEKGAGKKYKNYEIPYRVVKKDDMYDYDNQKLLFPFVK